MCIDLGDPTEGLDLARILDADDAPLLRALDDDDGGDANNARTFATRLVEEDKIVAMVGGTTTGSTLAMIPVFEEAQIPFISLAGSVQIVEPVRKWCLRRLTLTGWPAKRSLRTSSIAI